MQALALTAVLMAYPVSALWESEETGAEVQEEAQAEVQEEMQEFRQELEALKESGGGDGCRSRAEGELGDLLFSIINAARLYDLNPDTALEMTNKKFRDRFTYLESKTIRQGLSLNDMTLGQMNELWEESKRMEHND